MKYWIFCYLLYLYFKAYFYVQDVFRYNIMCKISELRSSVDFRGHLSECSNVLNRNVELIYAVNKLYMLYMMWAFMTS